MRTPRRVLLSRADTHFWRLSLGVALGANVAAARTGKEGEQPNAVVHGVEGGKKERKRRNIVIY